MVKTSITLALVPVVAMAAWALQSTRPSPPLICGTHRGPPVTGPRIKLRDGRHLAYKETGLPRDKARFKVIYIHGFDSCRLDNVLTSVLHQGVAEELGVSVISFDRPGYGESDPHPERTGKSISLDIEELADQLDLGEKFYLVGASMGGQSVWNSLKYIPHRLAGAALFAPVVNYYWTGFPDDLMKEVFSQQLKQDQWMQRIAHYTPWLTYWWNTQKLFPASSVAAKISDKFNRQDLELLPKIMPLSQPHKEQVRQQGEYESIHRDINLAFGKWEFSPLDLDNPLKGKGLVHLWQGDEDGLVNVALQRYIAKSLPWIEYHEVPGGGHFFGHADGMAEAFLRALLLGHKEKN